MLDSLSPQRRRMVAVSIALAALVVLLLVGFALVRPAGPTPVASGEPGPVLLVAGYGGRVESLSPLATALESSGRRAVVVHPVGRNTGDLGAEAAHLAEVAEQVRRETGAPSVDVVGFSAGGLIARLWVRDHGGDGSARRILTLGSPHHGTNQAVLGPALAGGCPVACQQMAPDSDLLRRLNAGDETPAGPEWVTIRTDFDKVVTPISSATLDGALNLRVQDLCPRSTTAHGQLPADPVVRAALDSVLGPEPPTGPRAVRC